MDTNTRGQSSLVRTKTGLAATRYEVRVVVDRSEHSKYWSRNETTGRDMMHKMHRNYRDVPGYNGTRLVAVSNGVAVEIVDEVTDATRAQRLESA